MKRHLYVLIVLMLRKQSYIITSANCSKIEIQNFEPFRSAMLFKRNGRSVKFCLLGLDAEERKEIAKLITENGGEIRGPLNTRNNRVYGDAFHHLNYIHECLRQGELLDLHPFRTLSLRSLTRKNRGSFFADDDVGRIYVEHNYSKVCVKREGDGSELPTLTPQAPLIVLAPSLDDMSLVYIRYLRQMYSLMIKKDGENETQDCTSLEKREETEKPRLWSPIVITRRWVRENTSKAVPQTDDKKLAMRNRTRSPKIVETPRIRPTAVEEQKIHRSIEESDETPLIQRLQGILDDVPLAERLRRTRTPSVEESEDSDDSLKISPTLRKRRILSSSSEDSEDSDATVLLKDSGRTKHSNRDKGSLDVETEGNISEHSYDSEETVLWADFSRKKKGSDRRKSEDRRKPTCIYSDSTDTETFSLRNCPVREKEFRRSGESQAITRIRSSTRDFLSSSSDETEYDEPPGTSRTIEVDEEDDSSLDMEKKEPQKLRNGRDPSPIPGSSSKSTQGSTGSNNNVILIIDDSDSSSMSAAETAGVPNARIAVPVEAPEQRTWNRVERPAMNVERKIRYHRLTRNYARWEQKMMVKYLIDNNAVSLSMGYEIWKRMIADGLLTHRTYQSLQNHFRRSILPNIYRFGIGGFDLEDFRKLQS